MAENEETEQVVEPLMDIGEFSDGFHTFNELYRHRLALFAMLANSWRDSAWKSEKHDDGSMYDDWFIAGIETPCGPITYHAPLSAWDMFQVKELGSAPQWDGHTPDDVVKRLNQWVMKELVEDSV